MSHGLTKRVSQTSNLLQCQITQKNVSCSRDVSVGNIVTVRMRSPKCLLAPQCLVQSTASPARHERVALIAHDNRARGIELGLVDECLAKPVMRPGIHTTRCRRVDLAFCTPSHLLHVKLWQQHNPVVLTAISTASCEPRPISSGPACTSDKVPCAICTSLRSCLWPFKCASAAGLFRSNT